MKRLLLLLLVLVMFLTSCRTVKSNVTNETLPSDETVNVVMTDNAFNTDTTQAETETETALETVPETEKLPDNTVTEIKLDKYEVNLTAGSTDMPLVTMLPENASNKEEIWESSDEKVATVNWYGKITGVSKGECIVTVKSKANPEVSATVKVKVTGDASLTYIDGILIANKTYSLPSTYAPGVDKNAQSALDKMIAGAKSEGITLFLKSGYRSYSTQQTLYNNYVARDGVAAADRYSARAGHSEHQTGLAFDLNSLEQSFGETKEGIWLKNNCHKYGFIIRYPEGKEDVTGYMYEPWHVRYLGEDIATKVYESGKCLEEYLGITSRYE